MRLGGGVVNLMCAEHGTQEEEVRVAAGTVRHAAQEKAGVEAAVDLTSVRKHLIAIRELFIGKNRK